MKATQDWTSEVGSPDQPAGVLRNEVVGLGSGLQLSPRCWRLRTRRARIDWGMTWPELRAVDLGLRRAQAAQRPSAGDPRFRLSAKGFVRPSRIRAWKRARAKSRRPRCARSARGSREGSWSQSALWSLRSAQSRTTHLSINCQWRHTSVDALRPTVSRTSSAGLILESNV